jgi:hypothetical protein
MKVQACAPLRRLNVRSARTTLTSYGWVREPAAAGARERPVRSATPPMQPPCRRRQTASKLAQVDQPIGKSRGSQLSGLSRHDLNRFCKHLR